MSCSSSIIREETPRRVLGLVAVLVFGEVLPLSTAALLLAVSGAIYLLKSGVVSISEYKMGKMGKKKGGRRWLDLSALR